MRNINVEYYYLLLLLGNKVLDFVTEAKCLEIIIDNQLSWLSHIELIFRSFGQKVNQLKRHKYLTKDTLQSIYFTGIIPTVTYCNLVWGTCSPTLLPRLSIYLGYLMLATKML